MLASSGLFVCLFFLGFVLFLLVEFGVWFKPRISLSLGEISFSQPVFLFCLFVCCLFVKECVFGAVWLLHFSQSAYQIAARHLPQSPIETGTLFPFSCSFVSFQLYVTLRKERQTKAPFYFFSLLVK